MSATHCPWHCQSLWSPSKLLFILPFWSDMAQGHLHLAHLNRDIQMQPSSASPLEGRSPTSVHYRNGNQRRFSMEVTRKLIDKLCPVAEMMLMEFWEMPPPFKHSKINLQTWHWRELTSNISGLSSFLLICGVFCYIIIVYMFKSRSCSHNS